MSKPSTAEYQRGRKSTLRAVDRARVLEVALELMRENRRDRKKRYRRQTVQILQGKAH